MTLADLTGMKYGRLTVSGFSHRTRSSAGKAYPWWSCSCECGAIITVKADNLRTGHTRSCGCFRTESMVRRFTKHGLTESREFKIWTGMWNRCTNQNSSTWKYYGALGVTVCDRWTSFELFLEDMKNRPSPKHSIDRFPNPYGNYEPSNCRWATAIEQRHNQRKKCA